jgi:hypothetical protein
LDAAKGPPVKLSVPPGEIVPLDGVVAAIAALANTNETNSRSVLSLVSVINLLLAFSDERGSTTTDAARMRSLGLDD